METYQYPKSQGLFLKATESIPAGIYGHLGPAEGCFIPIDAYPLYADHAKGAYFWDVDGNRFIDYMCAYGPIILGYVDEEVEEAARRQAEKGNCMTLGSPLMVELAEEMKDCVASADWAFFAKNGGDVTNFAMISARAATGRSKVMKFNGGYHGVAPWMTQLGYPGVTEEDMVNVISIPFNDFAAMEAAVARNKEQIACLIATPYHHPAFGDSQYPGEGYWKKVRELCTREGIVLIIDDVRCGFRLDLQGSDHAFGFEADLICFCKALGNGHNISALCGKNALKAAVSSVFYTGSYWLSAVPMAASLACVRKLRRIDAANKMLTIGRRFKELMEKAAESEGFRLAITGAPSMPFMRTEDDPSGMIHQYFVGECVRRGVFFTNHHNIFMNCAMSEEDLQFTAEVAADAYRAVKKDHSRLLRQK